MLKTITIQQIDFYDKKKDGTPLTYVSKKDGNIYPYKKVRIKSEGSDFWGAAFGKSELLNWKEGETHDILVKEENGYLNFELPRANNLLEARLEALEKRVKALEDFQVNPFNEEETKSQDIPF